MGALAMSTSDCCGMMFLLSGKTAGSKRSARGSASRASRSTKAGMVARFRRRTAQASIAAPAPTAPGRSSTRPSRWGRQRLYLVRIALSCWGRRHQPVDSKESSIWTLTLVRTRSASRALNDGDRHQATAKPPIRMLRPASDDELYGRILVPQQVVVELTDPAAPREVRNWAKTLPGWVDVRSISAQRRPRVVPSRSRRTIRHCACPVGSRGALVDRRCCRSARGITARHSGSCSSDSLLAPDRVDESAVARHIPYGDARPLPAARLGSPLEGLAAEFAGVRQLDDVAVRGLTVAPDNLGEPKREGPDRANARHDLRRRRGRKIDVRQEHLAGRGEELTLRQRRERFSPPIERREAI